MIGSETGALSYLCKYRCKCTGDLPVDKSPYPGPSSLPGIESAQQILWIRGSKTEVLNNPGYKLELHRGLKVCVCIYIYIHQ
jgi:hypothetical protein